MDKRHLEHFVYLFIYIDFFYLVCNFFKYANRNFSKRDCQPSRKSVTGLGGGGGGGGLGGGCGNMLHKTCMTFDITMLTNLYFN